MRTFDRALGVESVYDWMLNKGRNGKITHRG